MSGLFVPGRLCLFGEHSDWAARYRDTHPQLERGYCLVAGTDQGLRARVEPASARFELRTRLASGDVLGPVEIPATLPALRAAASEPGFFRYAAGAACIMLERYGVAAVRIDIDSDLPARKGLSSSAAVCVLTARAISDAHGLDLGIRDEMDVAYAGERLTGSECGRLDQVCALGRGVTRLVIDGEVLELEPVAPGAVFHLLVVDLAKGKDTRRILSDLNACYPDAPGATAAGVRAALGPANLRLHAVARRALEAGDVGGLGRAMTEAQALFDRDVAPACPELASPMLHRVLESGPARELAHGGKGVGSQGDGCAQFVAKGARERDELARCLATEFGLQGYGLTLEPVESVTLPSSATK